MNFEDNENIIEHFLVSFDIFVLEKIRVDRGLDNFENLVGSVLKKAAFRCHHLAERGFRVDTYFHKLDALKKYFVVRVNEKSQLLAERNSIPGFVYFDQCKEGSRGFICNIPSILSDNFETETLEEKRKRAMKNIGMIKIINVQSCDSFRSLRDRLSEFRDNDGGIISVMLRLRSIENLVFVKFSNEESLAQYCRDLSDVKVLVNIFDEYRRLAHYFSTHKSFVELLGVEERSRGLLVEWIIYSMLFSFVQRMHKVSSSLVIYMIIHVLSL